MTDRLLTPDVHRAEAAPLTTLGGLEIGLWEMGPGVDHDTEVDEVFVVLSGRGRIDFEDGTSIELTPGVAVRLHAGDRTTWTVTQSLRKVYVAV